MLINGIPITPGTSIAEILYKLAALPSSFPYYNNYYKPLFTPDEQKEYDSTKILHNSADIELKILGNPEAALNLLQRAENVKVVQNDWAFLSDINYLMANAYEKIPDLDKALQKLEKAALYAVESRQYDKAENYYKELANLYNKIGKLNAYEERLVPNFINSINDNNQIKKLYVCLALGATYKLLNEHDLALELYSKAYSLQQSQVDYSAFRVEQHEVGFSSKEKLGTDNIQQCVAVIIYDPQSKKTALAHIDRFTKPDSLSKNVLSQFTTSSNKLQVYLVGGRDRYDASATISDNNIKKVIEELNKHPYINIKSADIGDKEIPSGIIFDPVTGTLEHTVPGREDASTCIRQARLNLIDLQDNSSDLFIAFDLTESKNISVPILIRDQQKSIIEKWYDSYFSLSPLTNSSDAWSANQIYNPLNKATEYFKEKDFNLVKNVLENKILKSIRQINPSATNSDTISFLDNTLKPLSNEKLSLLEIRKEIESSINRYKSIIATAITQPPAKRLKTGPSFSKFP